MAASLKGVAHWVEHCRRLWTQSFDQPRKTFEAGFASLAEGTYTVKIEAVGFATTQIAGREVRAGVDTRVEVVMAAGAVVMGGGWLVIGRVSVHRALAEGSNE